MTRTDKWGWAGKGWAFYIHWKHWSWEKTTRFNGTLMWGANPYTSYHYGPFDLRIYHS